MPPEKWTPGPTGDRVADNLKVFRGALTLEELSERLTKLGRRIAPDSIRNAEQTGGARRRRIDVDDLIALSIALGVTPNRLLLPGTSSVHEPVELTPTAAAPSSVVWGWANGQAVIELWWPSGVPIGGSPTGLSLEEFRRRVLPPRQRAGPGVVVGVGDWLSAVAEVAKVVDAQATRHEMHPMALLNLVIDQYAQEGVREGGTDGG